MIRHLLFVSLILVTSLFASNKVLLFQPLENPQVVTAQEAARINEIFLQRLQGMQGWILVDSAKLAEILPTGKSCDQDCLTAAAQQLGADLVLTGVINATTDVGQVDVVASLYEPATWRELQRESCIIGPDIERGLGQVSGMAKLFDASSPSASAAITPDSKPNTTSTVVNWILGGTAMMVLAVVLYSLL
ncbi:MAG TPA: hypothetical protein VLM37_01040 [Fibrobacteraceae bacterium]|nr:hypothetical protein [Fibrobacteraceae bacterium]